MRYDLLDEYATLVPFGYGVSKYNRVVQYSSAPTQAVEHGATANRKGRLERLLKLVVALRHIGRRAVHRSTH